MTRRTNNFVTKRDLCIVIHMCIDFFIEYSLESFYPYSCHMECFLKSFYKLHILILGCTVHSEAISGR